MNKPASSTEQSVAAQHWAALGIGYHTRSNSELLELYSYSRSSAVLSEIVKRHSPLVASVVRRLISNSQDAEDAFQATFLVLVLSVNRIRNPDSLSAWLYGVAFRTAKRMRRMRRKNNIKVALQSTVGIDLDEAQSPVEEPLAIIQDIVQGAGTDVEIDPDRRSAIHGAIRQAREGDIVVIAGKGHEQGQEIGDEKLPFDDREVAREALRG